MKLPIKSLFILPFVFMACDNPSAPANGNDVYESDDAYTAATALTVGAPSQNHVLTQNDQDWFSFSAVAGKGYEIRTAGSTHTFLELYGKNGATLLHGIESFDSDGNAIVDWTCDSSGTFYFKVRGYDGEQTGGYSISATSIIPQVGPDSYESDDSAKSANKISNSGSQQSHTLTKNDKDWFVFNAVKGTGYLIATSGYADTYLELYNQTGTVLLAKNDDTGSSVNSAIQWTCDSSGLYYFKVRGSTGEQTGSYTINISNLVQTTADSYEPDNSYSTAAFITTSSSQSHTLTTNDQDWIKFTTVAGGQYTIYTSTYYTTNNVATDTYLELYGPNGTTLLAQNDDGGTNGNASITWTSDSATTYYVKVRGYNSKVTGAYSISLSAVLPPAPDSYEPDSTYTLAGTITVNGSSQVHTLTPNDQDWIKFSAASGVTYSLDAYGTMNVKVDLFDRNGTALISSDTVGVGISWSCITSGTYFLRVRGLTNTAIGSYSISVQTNGIASALSDVYEPDNIYTAATSIIVNGTGQNHTLTGASSTVFSSDVDWFSFTAVAGKTYVMQTTGGADPELDLYDRNGTTILNSNIDGGVGLDNALISWTCTVAGTYYFRVIQAGSGNGNGDILNGSYLITVTSN